MLHYAKLPDNVDELQALLSAQCTEVEALKLESNALKLERDTLKLISSDDKQEIQRLSLLLDMLRRKLRWSEVRETQPTDQSAGT